MNLSQTVRTVSYKKNKSRIQLIIFQ